MKAAVYTRTGDKGTTGLYTGDSVPKQSMRVELTVQLMRSVLVLGLAELQSDAKMSGKRFNKVQQLLMSLMADIASLICLSLISKKSM